MTRRMPRLVELQPEAFVEISVSLAASERIGNGERVVLETARGSVTLKALVTPRLAPTVVDGRLVEVVWAPMHYGPLGLATGPVVNQVTLDALEPNVGIQETKACLCRVRRAPPGGAVAG
jgi:formate dehydrogenase major subunit